MKGESMLERFFKLREHNTTPGTEVAAGLATFLTAAYILVVNPSIQADAGMPRDALFTATAVAILVGTLLMGLFANMPFILAPGMGLNAYFAYTVVLGQKFTWQEAITAVFLAGILFFVTGALGLRKILLDGFPEPLKHAMTVSLGLMIASIGLKNAGVVEFHEGIILLGNVTKGGPLLAMIGIVITGIFLCLKMRTAVLLGIVATTLVGMFMTAKGVPITDYQSVIEKGAVSLPPSLSPIAFAFDFNLERILSTEFLITIFVFFALDIFDSLGTFIGVFNHFSGEEKKKYEAVIPRALMCDAAATVVGACIGTSTVTTYVESSTGIQAGGRTGLTALTIAGLVFIALFASPLFLMVPAAATAPALVVVGMYMMAMALKLEWGDIAEALPAVLMILITTLTWSISNGLMFGWIGYTLFKLVTGRARELNATVYVVFAFFVVRLATMYTAS